VHTIVYASTANETFSDEDLAELLAESRFTNERLSLTGALLYRNGRFAQVLEGPEEAVRSIYASIVADARHRDIRLVTDTTITFRRFSNWTMAYRPLDEDRRADIAEFNRAVESDTGLAELTADAVELMFEEMQDSQPATPAEPEPEIDVNQIGSSRVVTSIFEKIMADVRNGVLLPGDRMNDGNIAQLMGTSRTPVREALQMLRSIGVVEVSANRFTRIAVVDAEQATQLIVVLAALYGAVLHEVIGNVGDATVALMLSDLEEFTAAIGRQDELQIIGCAANFYMRLVEVSENPVLKRSINSVVHAVRLAGPHLEGLIGLDALAMSQSTLLAAAGSGDVAEAQRGLAMLVERR
jgi:DNA-binding GntR family transcriptional regulator